MRKTGVQTQDVNFVFVLSDLLSVDVGAEGAVSLALLDLGGQPVAR